MTMPSSYAASNITPWAVLGTGQSTAFNLIDIDDVVDTTTKPATNLTTGRFVGPCDAGGMCLLRMIGSDAENTDFKIRVYTWSKLVYPAMTTGAEFWTPHYHGEVLCTLGSMAVNGDGVIGGDGGYTYVDTMSITNNSGLGSGMRLIGRDNGAGDGTITADQAPIILAFDRLGDDLVEIQTAVTTASAARPMVKFVSNV